MKRVLFLVVALSAMLMAPSGGAQDAIYLRLVGSSPQQPLVGYRVESSPPQAATCASVDPKYQATMIQGPWCTVCLHDDPVGPYPAPGEQIARGALGLFHQIGKFGKYYAFDFDCLQQNWGCLNGWDTWRCESCEQLDDDLVVWNLGAWSFDGDVGEKWVGDQNVSTQLPGFAAGVRGLAAAFTEGKQHVEYPAAETLLALLADGDFSVEGWVRTKSSGTQVIASKRSGNSSTAGVTWGGDWLPHHVGTHLLFRGQSGRDGTPRDFDCSCPTQGYCGFQVITSGGRIGLQLAHAGEWYNYLAPSQPQNRIDDGNWHHFAITVNRSKSGDGITFYRDGVAIGTDNPDRIQGCLNNDEPLFIGGQSQSSLFPFIGELDELTFWAAELYADEVAAIHEASNQGHCYYAW